MAVMKEKVEKATYPRLTDFHKDMRTIFSAATKVTGAVM